MSRRFGLVAALLVAVSAIAALVAGTASPAAAITNGEPDGNDHPGVGALLADKAFPDGTWSYCTGTLISPTVFLTAAHCNESSQKTARVAFSSQYRDGDQVHVGRFIPDPRFHDEKSDSPDIAVVIFDKPVSGIEPAKLPTVGLLDQLKADGSLKTATFTPVGFGAQVQLKGPGGNTFTYTDRRNVATSTGSLKSLTSSWLELSQNAKHGHGGTCDGDSGGPVFLRNLLVATTVTGDDACRLTNVDFRLDTNEARSFLGQFVSLP